MSSRNIVLAASGGAANYIEDVFSTYLYTGNGAIQTITNGIDLSTKGGLVWIKSRSTVSYDHLIFDTTRGINQSLNTTLTNGEQTTANSVTSFTNSGFSLGNANFVNGTGGGNFVSWSFREQSKFFDVVNYTGTGANRTIPHNLGSIPGCIIVKRTDTTGNWRVYHNSLTSAAYGLQLNSTSLQASDATLWNSTAPTSSTFSLGTNVDVNANAGTYVAYIFAHNAGGFGLTGGDNAVSCGSFTTDGSGNATVTLGYEPQWVLIKESTTAGGLFGWILLDTMRGWSMSSLDNPLYAQSSGAESSFGGGTPTATGFVSPTLVASSTYIYIAIRRPNKRPTSGAQVFSPIAYNGNGGTNSIGPTTIVAPDLFWAKWRAGTPGNSSHNIWDRLRGVDYRLFSNSTSAEASAPINSFDMKGVTLNVSYANTLSTTYIGLFFRRAQGVFDIVCYTGTGTGRAIAHNLGVAPELMIIKGRNDNTGNMFWAVFNTNIGNDYILKLNDTSTRTAVGLEWWTQDGVTRKSPDASNFYVNTAIQINQTSEQFVAYLFATLAGVSKVGSYTGNGSSQTINCGFAGGARFVLIKQTSGGGSDWWIWDYARGIVADTDPHLSLNTTAAEVTTDDSIDPEVSGFIVNNVAATNINVNAETYIYLAIA